MCASQMTDLEKSIDFESPNVKAAVERITAASERVAEVEARRDKLMKEMGSYNANKATEEMEEEAQAEVMPGIECEL